MGLPIYTTLPAFIRYSKLSAAAKLLYSELLINSDVNGNLKNVPPMTVYSKRLHIPQEETDKAMNELQENGYADYERIALTAPVALPKTTVEKAADTGNTNGTVIAVDVQKVINFLYDQYPVKTGKANGAIRIRQWLTTGKSATATGKKVKYNHYQLLYAINEYAYECEQNHTEVQYIKHFDTFFGLVVMDYVEKSREGYEKKMNEKYGANWSEQRFIYK